MVKRFVSFLIILSFFILPSFASKTTMLGCDDVTVKQGEIFTVPLNLTNNKGIVALRIKIKYPHNVMELADISSGELTQAGLFNTTVTDYYSVKGEFDVVWSTTENVVDDGTVVMLTFKVHDLAENGRYKIDLSYEKSDTFNENLDDVVLDCSPVIVTINNGSGVFDEPETTGNISIENTQVTDEITETSLEETTQKALNNKPEISDALNEDHNTVSDDYFISSVESIVDSLNETDIDNITDSTTQQIVIDFVNNRLEAFDENIPHIESFEELKEAFSEAKENETIKEIVETVDSDVILSLYDELKTKYGINELKEIPKEKEQEVITKVTEVLIENNADIETFNKLKDNQKFSVFKEIFEKVIEQEESSIDITEESSFTPNQHIIIVVSILIALLAVIIVVWVIFRKLRKKGKSK